MRREIETKSSKFISGCAIIDMDVNGTKINFTVDQDDMKELAFDFLDGVDEAIFFHKTDTSEITKKLDEVRDLITLTMDAHKEDEP